MSSEEKSPYDDEDSSEVQSDDDYMSDGEKEWLAGYPEPETPPSPYHLAVLTISGFLAGGIPLVFNTWPGQCAGVALAVVTVGEVGYITYKFSRMNF